MLQVILYIYFINMQLVRVVVGARALKGSLAVGAAAAVVASDIVLSFAPPSV